MGKELKVNIDAANTLEDEEFDKLLKEKESETFQGLEEVVNSVEESLKEKEKLTLLEKEKLTLLENGLRARIAPVSQAIKTFINSDLHNRDPKSIADLHKIYNAIPGNLLDQNQVKNCLSVIKDKKSTCKYLLDEIDKLSYVLLDALHVQVPQVSKPATAFTGAMIGATIGAGIGIALSFFTFGLSIVIGIAAGAVLGALGGLYKANSFDKKLFNNTVDKVVAEKKVDDLSQAQNSEPHTHIHSSTSQMGFLHAENSKHLNDLYVLVEDEGEVQFQKVDDEVREILNTPDDELDDGEGEKELPHPGR